MRSDQFKSVSDRELAEQYLAMSEEDKDSVEREIINRFVDSQARPRTGKARAKSMIPIIIGTYLGGVLGKLLSAYSGSLAELFIESLGYLVGALIATAFIVIYTMVKYRR